MAKLPAGKASVPIKAGHGVEVERIAEDGTKWLRPLTIGVAISNSMPVPGTRLRQVAVQVHGDLGTRSIGTAMHDAKAGEWVFTW
jgi:hypothetical protein